MEEYVVESEDDEDKEDGWILTSDLMMPKLKYLG